MDEKGGEFTVSIFDTIELHNGVKMPAFGLGVYKVEEGEQLEKTIHTALDLGYRLIDTASFYQNEEGVGQAIRNSGIPREELFITTKVWNSEQGYENTLKAFDDSMERLGLDYLDLYLVHWPVKGKYLETWRALEELYREGRVKAIGVSNFKIHHLKDLLSHAAEKPVINQVELHPLLSQVELREFCQQNEIKVEAWSPLSRGRFLEEPVLGKIAAQHGKTPAQVILRWHLENQIIPIPKSVTPARLKENTEIFDFQLNQKELEEINGLNKDQRFGADPDHIDF
ncbi:aldo/keto reductase [Mesobacillus selenatarsenatis]|uniref:Oxidoreductase of aldo/keto reductase family, subgroup 1 n=1 Tax=Mesobacillus selenatarsenatis (strain DSM 18680 / JCM 14380 / FERM P-15431 / SF-1) TaxID=1321606 RepID=A0A0A8X987_MESS1|nr:aldo/keto reductase [Mesobacillus selenatarsenatis]GAM16515.1 oxidoreductase of aldo/keto reductase family, subgroup 1 [Mesobacillus selenatarsenatis SF-1]